jgi:predicted ester cyclase
MATIQDDVTWSLDATKDPISAAEAVRTLIEAMIAAIPDMHYELVQILGAGNEHVVIRYVLRGTREGDFMGIAPSHNKIEMHGCVISEIKDGKRYRMWQYASGPGLLDQLGASKS